MTYIECQCGPQTHARVNHGLIFYYLSDFCQNLLLDRSNDMLLPKWFIKTLLEAKMGQLQNVLI